MLAGLLFHVKPSDPATFAFVFVVLMGTALCVAQPVSAQMDPLKEVAVVHFRQRGS